MPKSYEQVAQLWKKRKKKKKRCKLWRRVRVVATRITGRLKALTPVYHGGNEKTGSVVLLNRLKFIVDGEPTDVPIMYQKGMN